MFIIYSPDGNNVYGARGREFEVLGHVSCAFIGILGNFF